MTENNRTQVSIDGNMSSIRFDRNIYDLISAEKIISSFPELKIAYDEGDLIVLIEDNDLDLLRDNTLNLCNIILDKCLKKREKND